MTYTHYQRLSALDTIFLDLEGPNVHMHVGAVAIFENCTSLRTEAGALDIERIRSYVATQINDAPRFRQRLRSIPIVDHPIWVDDDRFKVRYHVRHTALPAPGGLRQLKRTAGRIMSQQLDRAKPMWEMWVVEGIERDRFALIIKAHHCMVDGVSGIDLIKAILHPETDPHAVRPSRDWLPRRKPTGTRLLFDEAVRRACVPLDMARAVPRVLAEPRRSFTQLKESVLSVAEAVGAGLVRTTASPLNPEIGPYRKFDWTEFDIADIKRIRQAFGGTLNDVVLATVAGMVGRFLSRRGESVSAETVFRAMVPVNMRKATDPVGPGNHVVNLFARLPIDEKDPRKRLEIVTELTAELKTSRMAAGTEAIEEIIDLTFTGLLADLAQLATYTRAYNLVVTNVPGPPSPVAFMGARLRSIFPLVPLFTNQALGIALFSYAGKLCWGLNADWDAIPDLHDLVVDLDDEFRKLCELAAAETKAAEHQPGRNGAVWREPKSTDAVPMPRQ
jgi:diacylglycerol O-acyltransferase